MYITAVFVLPFMVLVPLIYRNVGEAPLWQRYAGVVGGFALTGGLSAIFLVPVLLETQYILIGQGLEDTNRFLLEHFIPFHHLLEIPQVLDVTDQRIIIPQTLGAISLVLGGVGVASLWLRGKRRLAALLLLLLLFTILMTNRVSFDLWLLIPQFNKLRFPDRILRMSTVLLALLIGGSIMVIPKRWQLLGVVVGFTLLLVQVLPLLEPRLDDYNIPAWSPSAEIVYEAENQVWGATAYNEFKPNFGSRTLYDTPGDLAAYDADPFRIVVHDQDLIRQGGKLVTEQMDTETLQITTTEAMAVRFRQFYFPGWEVLVDGESVPIGTLTLIWVF